MPNNPTHIIRDGEVIENDWQLIEKSDQLSGENVIVPYLIFKEHQELYTQCNIGVWIKNDCDIDAISDDIIRLPIIAIEFPIFTDGRGFSLARILRERFHYTGEIRAIGYPIRDQLCYLKRCGFNAFAFDDGDVDLSEALSSLNDFTEAYQSSVDQPLPLFKRRNS